MTRVIVIATGILTLMFGSSFATAQDNCTYRKNNLGDYTYTCADGTKGTLRQNNLGHYQDDRTGTVYRRNNLGHYRSSDGKQTWRRDDLNNWRSGDQVCRENFLGQTVCSKR